MKRRFVLIQLVIFAVLTGLFLGLHAMQPAFDTLALHTANTLMLVLSISAHKLVNRKIAGRPQAFVQGVYSASLLRLMVCMVAMLAYVMLNRHNIHKPTVFVLFGVYAVYSAAETILLSKTARTSRSADAAS